MSVFLSLLLACGGEEPTAKPTTPEVVAPAPAQVPPQVSRAVELARVVQADPTNADAALAAKGSSRAELDKLMYEIAADPGLTDAYARELGR